MTSRFTLPGGALNAAQLQTLAELADNYYRPVVELIVKWLEEQRLEMDVSGNKMAAVVATCLTHMLNQLNRTMTVYNVDFVAAFEFFLARSVHPLWMESLPDLSYFRRDDMNVIYFVQVHLHKYPKFAFLWNKKGVDETTAGMVNFLLLFALDLLLNILLIVLRLVLRLRQQTEVQELSLNYALYFVCSLSSSTSPLFASNTFAVAITRAAPERSRSSRKPARTASTSSAPGVPSLACTLPRRTDLAQRR